MASFRKKSPGGTATLADIGRLAGVSIASASKVLHHVRSSAHISPQTRERIIAAAAELHYRPNLAARALVSRRMHTLGVATVVQGGELNHYFLEIFNGIVTTAADHGQNTTAFTLRDWQGGAARLRDFCDGRIDGIILLAPTFDPAQVVLPGHTPFVAIHANGNLPGVANIESDEEEGACALVRHLTARGHRRIMHLRGPSGFIGAERRVQGYKRALREAGIPFDPELLVGAGYTAGHGREAMQAWLESHAGRALPQAVFCANDASAIGCSEALAERGLRVPDDVSLAGFDDTLAARSVVPQLTSVRQPLREMGARAVELLLSRIGGAVSPPGRAPKPVVFPVEVISRASLGAPPPVARSVPVLGRADSGARPVAPARPPQVGFFSTHFAGGFPK